MDRLRQKYVCENGDIWEIWMVEYDTDKYFKGGRDIVTQFKKNGYEQGHITEHYDGAGVMRQKNIHGIVSIPDGCK